jgi:hypothetical protein
MSAGNGGQVLEVFSGRDFRAQGIAIRPSGSLAGDRGPHDSRLSD